MSWNRIKKVTLI